MNLNAELIYLVDLTEKISGFHKAKAWLTARFMPFGMLTRKLGLAWIA